MASDSSVKVTLKLPLTCQLLHDFNALTSNQHVQISNFSMWHLQVFHPFHRDSQEGTLEVDGGKSMKKTSPGELRKLNADTVLYVGMLSSKIHLYFLHPHILILNTKLIDALLNRSILSLSHTLTHRWNAGRNLLHQTEISFWNGWMHIGNCFGRRTET